MKGVVTVLGKDKVGIIAEVSHLFYRLNINIDGINQGILEDLFTMVMLVEMGEMNASYDLVQSELDAISQRLGVDIRIQKSAIFEAMHII